MKKVIVSGANGFVGGALVKELTAHGIQVIALDLEGHTDNPVSYTHLPGMRIDCIMGERQAGSRRSVPLYERRIVLRRRGRRRIS